MGYRGNYQCTLDWALIAKLYTAGHGVKTIGKRAGGSPGGIREGLIKRGLYQFGQNRKANGTGDWVGYYDAEIRPMLDAERHHQRWWRRANPKTTVRPTNQYYAKIARARYWRIKDTPEYKAEQFARAQLRRIKRQAMGYAKTCRTHEYLGCTYQQAADHITTQLQTGWTWANYGKAWEIDHKIQLSDGPLTDSAHVRAVCHYTNLRPMAVVDNRTRQWGPYAGRQATA